MIKKYLFILVFVTLLVLSELHAPVYADHDDEKVTTTTTKIVTVEYALPFAGIMPNHPLYFFKTLRDTLIEKMITNDVKKAEFYILQADKRLQMSIALSGVQEKALSETVRNDALMYREKALTTLTTASEKNIVIPRYVLEKLLVSTKKHEEVLLGVHVDTASIKALIPKIEALLSRVTDKK